MEVKETKKRNQNIDLLKSIACIGITNSHAPYTLGLLNIGGGHGNALFFVVSGYLLYRCSEPMGQWLVKRYRRLWQPAILVFAVVIFLCFKPETLWRLIDLYWFLFAISIYYPIYYLIMRYCNLRTGSLCLGIWLVIYAVLYFVFCDRNIFFVEPAGFAAFKVYFYFGIFLVGGLFGRYMEQRKDKKIHDIIVWGLLFLSLFAWCFEYANIKVWDRLVSWQGIIHISILTFAIVMLLLAIEILPKYIWMNRLMGNKWIGKLIQMISNATLEVYLVQITILFAIQQCHLTNNVIVFWSAAIVGGVLYSKVNNKLFERKKV